MYPTALELAVLEKLLQGNHPILSALRAQLQGLLVKEREYSGVGFFSELAVLAGALPAAVPLETISFGDVIAIVDGVDNDIGFLLTIKHGLLHDLEGYTFNDPWPDDIIEFEIKYINSDRSSELNMICVACQLT